MDDDIRIAPRDTNSQRANRARHAETPRPSMLTDLLLIEPDDDCADALHALLTSLEGVGEVLLAESPRGALQALEHDGVRPTVVFVATHAAKAALAPTLAALRKLLPGVAIVLLSVYPERVHPDVAALVDCCLSKDTGRRELQALLTSLTQAAIAAD